MVLTDITQGEDVTSKLFAKSSTNGRNHRNNTAVTVADFPSKGLQRLLATAVTNSTFCQLLLTSPEKVVGTECEFQLTAAEKIVISHIRAATLLTFVEQLVSAMNVLGNGRYPQE